MTRVQLPLGLTNAIAAMGEADFVVSDNNREAFAWVAEQWPNWPAHGLVLRGPRGSGKSHLAKIWAHRANAEFLEVPALSGGARLVLENVERFFGDAEAEEMLFHLLNQLAAHKGHILLTAEAAPVLWPVKLPDLRSRLLALPVASIEAPDDEALTAVISKLFSDRQLRVPAEVIDYLVRRIERSYASAHAAVVACDAAALATGRPITLPLVREVLARGVELAG